jgi:hypothetical protein
VIAEEISQGLEEKVGKAREVGEFIDYPILMRKLHGRHR